MAATYDPTLPYAAHSLSMVEVRAQPNINFSGKYPQQPHQRSIERKSVACPLPI
jgi:hypothetical protein